VAGRIRSIKPEILEDDRTAGLDDATFRMFVSGLLLADDYGNLRANPGLLHASIFWAARDPRESLAKVSAGLETLAGLGLWRLYVEHGDMARAVLHREWTPLWMYAYARLDGLLERAGVPLADEGLVLL